MQQCFLRIHDVSDITTLGKNTIRLWVKQGRFPAPIQISTTIKVWTAEQIQQWVEQTTNSCQKEEKVQ